MKSFVDFDFKSIIVFYSIKFILEIHRFWTFHNSTKLLRIAITEYLSVGITTAAAFSGPSRKTCGINYYKYYRLEFLLFPLDHLYFKTCFYQISQRLWVTLSNFSWLKSGWATFDPEWHCRYNCLMFNAVSFQ